ncbi:MAG: hypothetical protein RDU89_00095 [bacterium]|nr:hypothetical protein [bacterium]
MAIPSDRFFSLQEICVLLNIAPKTFRQLLREYGEFLEWELPDTAEPPRGLPGEVFDRLRTIVTLRAKGDSDESIRRALTVASTGTEAPGVPLRVAEEKDVANSVVVALLREIGEDVKRVEDRWQEEREKILTALIRVQQELQTLRYELSTQSSRRSRKRKAFWASLFGP